MNRRRFISRATGAAGAICLAKNSFGASENLEKSSEFLTMSETILEGEMTYRTLGATGKKVSAIGLGGSHIGKPEMESELLAKTASAATGKYKKFKTDSKFDGTAKNPKWLGGTQENQFWITNYKLRMSKNIRGSVKIKNASAILRQKHFLFLDVLGN